MYIYIYMWFYMHTSPSRTPGSNSSKLKQYVFRQWSKTDLMQATEHLTCLPSSSTLIQVNCGWCFVIWSKDVSPKPKSNIQFHKSTCLNQVVPFDFGSLERYIHKNTYSNYYKYTGLQNCQNIPGIDSPFRVFMFHSTGSSDLLPKGRWIPVMRWLSIVQKSWFSGK